MPKQPKVLDKLNNEDIALRFSFRDTRFYKTKDGQWYKCELYRWTDCKYEPISEPKYEPITEESAFIGIPLLIDSSQGRIRFLEEQNDKLIKESKETEELERTIQKLEGTIRGLKCLLSQSVNFIHHEN